MGFLKRWEIKNFRIFLGFFSSSNFSSIFYIFFSKYSLQTSSFLQKIGGGVFIEIQEKWETVWWCTPSLAISSFSWFLVRSSHNYLEAFWTSISSNFISLKSSRFLVSIGSNLASLELQSSRYSVRKGGDAV